MLTYCARKRKDKNKSLKPNKYISILYMTETELVRPTKMDSYISSVLLKLQGREDISRKIYTPVFHPLKGKAKIYTQESAGRFIHT